MNEITKFGTELKAIMAERQIKTVSKMAEMVSTSSTALSAYIRGKRPVSMGFIGRLIIVLGDQYRGRLIAAAGESADGLKIQKGRAEVALQMENERLRSALTAAVSELDAIKTARQRPLVMSLREKVREIALECGFKLKEQPDGTQELNQYVYELAAQLSAEAFGDGWYDGYSDCAADNGISPDSVDLIRGSERAEDGYAKRIRIV